MQRDKWERCADPRLLLSTVGEVGDHPDRGVYGATPHKASDRKFLLVAAAVLRDLAPTTDPVIQTLITGMVLDAEGWAETGKRSDRDAYRAETPEEYARISLQWVVHHRGWETLSYSLTQHQCGIIRDTINPWAKTTWLICHVCKGNRVLTSGMTGGAGTGVAAAPCVVCDGSGVNPSFPKPAWVTDLVLDIGWQAYCQLDKVGTLDTGRLMVLSDALEEAGCDREGIMAHLRSPGPHYRGMWSLDQVLGLR